MTGPRRLPPDAPARFGTAIDRAEPVGFRFGGRHFSGLTGDTLASALSANGVRYWASSARLRRARGPLGSGLESQTPVMVDGAGGHWAAVAPDDVVIREGLNARPAPLGLDGVLSRLPQGAASAGRALPAPKRLVERIGRILPIPAPRLPPVEAAIEALRAYPDVLVIGAGPAGLAAAEAALSAGLDVHVVDSAARAGGTADLQDATIAGVPSGLWAEQRALSLRARDALSLRATAGSIGDDGAVSVIERPDPADPSRVRLRLVSAKAVIVATGFRERPLVFRDNDRPGVTLSQAARSMLRRHAVAPGERVIVATLSDDGYRTALDLKQAGVAVELIIDGRDDPHGLAVETAKAHGVHVSLSSLVTGVDYDERERRLTAVGVVNRYGEGVSAGARLLPADALIVSGGFAPRDELVRGATLTEEHGLFTAFAGSAIEDAVAAGWRAGAAAAAHLGKRAQSAPAGAEVARDEPDGPISVCFERLAPDAETAFVDFGADVAFRDVAIAAGLWTGGGDGLARRLGLGQGVEGGRLSADLPAHALSALTGQRPDMRPPSPARVTLGFLATRARLRD